MTSLSTFWYGTSYNKVRHAFKHHIQKRLNNLENQRNHLVVAYEKQLAADAMAFIHATDDLKHFFYWLNHDLSRDLLLHGYHAYDARATSHDEENLINRTKALTTLTHNIETHPNLPRLIRSYQHQYITCAILGFILLYSHTCYLSKGLALLCFLSAFEGLTCHNHLNNNQTFSYIKRFIDILGAENMARDIEANMTLKKLI